MIAERRALMLVDDVANGAGVSRDFAERVIGDLLHELDLAITDDESFYGGIVWGRRGDPVLERLKVCFESDEAELSQIGLMEPEELASALDLPVDVVEQYPIVWPWMLSLRVWERQGGVHEDDHLDAVDRVVQSWIDAVMTAGLISRLRVTPAGLERDFEDWLVGNLDRLASWEYPVEHVRRQWVLAGGCPDLVCRVAQDAEPLRRGDWLVIENKAVQADLPVLDQLNRYTAEIRRDHAGAGEEVFGLLLADGVTVPLQEALLATGVGYLSLSALGYREYLRQAVGVPAESEPDDVRAIATLTGLTGSEALGASGAESLRRRSTGTWSVGGVVYEDRRAANRALAAALGTYTSSEWVAAQRRHGLR